MKLPRDFAKRRPRQLSGGQKQRVGIARAFAGNPTVVIADEPVSALDVSVQAAVTELLMDIQREHRTTLLFISHDLSVVRYLADRVVVMYLGQIMEQGTTDEVFSPPYHPYTEALLSAVPIADTRVEEAHRAARARSPRRSIRRSGCPFQTRCHRKIGTDLRDRGAAAARVRRRPPDPLPPAARPTAGDGAGDRDGRCGAEGAPNSCTVDRARAIVPSFAQHRPGWGAGWRTHGRPCRLPA